VSFQGIIKIFQFDQSLRNAIWPVIETVEVAVRVAIAYQMGQYGAYAFIDPRYLADCAESPSIRDPNTTQLTEFRERMRRSVRASKESFAKHFRNNYEGTLPVWAAIELWDFGMLSSYYQIMNSTDRAAVAATYGIHSARLLGSWLEAINVLRNICAHHGRLNRRHIAIAPRIPKPKTSAEFAHLYPMTDVGRHTLYPLLCVLSYFSININRDMQWHSAFAATFNHIHEIPGVDFNDFGFPNNWLAQSLWAKEP
jgi:abortive infection bacteriophage resistance protein